MIENDTYDYIKDGSDVAGESRGEGEDINTLADVLLAGLLARDQAKETDAIRAGLEASDAGRVRPLAEVAAEMRAKYNLPTHLSDEEIFSGEEGTAHK